MLQNIRDNIQGVMAKIIIGIIIVPFAFFGIDGLVGSGGNVHVAEVNGDEVSASELEQAVFYQKRRILQSMGDNADPSLLDDALLQKTTLEQLIQQKLMLQAAVGAGIAVSDTAVDQQILGMAQFQEGGVFSPQRYQNILRSNGYTLTYFKSLVTDDIVMSQLSSGIAGSDFVTQRELSDAATLVAQKRSYRYINFPISQLANQAVLDDTEIEKFYSAHIDRYQSEPQVKLEYIEVKQADFTQPVSEQDIRDSYDLEVAEFKSKEERRASHILIEINSDRDEDQAKKLAQALLERINKGESFAELAIEYSDDPGSARSQGDLGYTQGDTFPPEFEEALFALEEGAVSAPVLTDAGFHLINATEVTTLEMPSYEERASYIKEQLALSQAEAEFISTVEQLRDHVFNSDGLKAPATDLMLTLSTSDWLDKGANNSMLFNPKVMAAAFSDEVLMERNNSEVLELASDHFIVVHVSDYKEAQPIPLDDVKSQISDELILKQATVLAKKKAEELKELLAESSRTVEEVAKEKGYAWQLEQSVTRTSATSNRELVQSIFALPRPAVDAATFNTVTLNNGDVVLVKLETVVDGNVSDLTPAEQQAVSAQLLRSNSMQGMNAFENSVRQAAEINIL